jgi:hypothetical protein
LKFKFLMVEMTNEEWQPIRQDLIAEYGISIFLSWRMKRELGCVRRISYVIDGIYPRDRIYLDFFDEMSYMSFVMRYS